MHIFNRHFVCVFLSIAVPSSSVGAEFIPLGFPSADASDRSSVANGVDAHGERVVGTTISNGKLLAYIWQQSTGMQAFDSTNTAFTANAISDNGSTIVGRAAVSSSFTDQAYVATVGATLQIIADASPNPIASAANAVSADGNVVVGWSLNSGQFQGFRWTETNGFEPLGHLGGDNPYSIADGISPDGNVIVGESDGLVGTEAFRWDRSNGMIGIGHLPGGDVSVAFDVSNDGKVIVGVGNIGTALNSYQAFRWEQSTGMIGLGVLPDTYPQSNASAVTSDGTAIVGVSGISDDQEAFVWDAAHGMRSLQALLADDPSTANSVSGWRLTFANDISADGRAIVGYGYDPDGRREAYLVRFDQPIGVPEPTSCLLLSLACIGSSMIRRRRLEYTAAVR